MRLKQLLYAAAIIFVATSCSTDADDAALLDESVTTDELAINFSASISTRATDVSFESGDEIAVSAYTSDGELYAGNSSYTFNDNLFSSSNPIRYTSINDELSFKAIYPFCEIGTGNSVYVKLSPDQSFGSCYTDSDLMYSHTESTSSTTPLLSFDHLLSKIVINISSSDVAMEEISATLEAEYYCTYYLDTYSTSGGNGNTQTITMAENGSLSYKAILTPQTFAQGTIFGSIIVDGISYYQLYADTDITLLTGREYTINATIKDGTISFDAPVVKDWIEGELGEVLPISSEEELAQIGKSMQYPNNGSYILTQDITLTSEWTPIDSFIGKFDGAGHTIYGLVISDDDAVYNYGLFGSISRATILNLTIENPDISGSHNVGAIAGEVYNCVVENCHINGGTISGLYTTVGLVGSFSGLTTIKSCSNICGIISTSVSAGGIMGKSGEADKLSVIGCCNSGEISGNQSGGIIGYAEDADIIACYNTGSVSGVYQVGGIVGSLSSYWDSSITACYNSGSLSSQENDQGEIASYANSATVISCFYITNSEINQVGVYNGSGGKDLTISELNGRIDEMNSAAGDTYYVAGSPAESTLPPLAWEVE